MTEDQDDGRAGDSRGTMLDAQRGRRELTELIVHDLKAPLLAVRAGLHWVRGQLLPGQSEVAEAIADAEAAAGRLSAMIGDLLTVSRIDEGELPLHRQPVPLAELINRVAHSYVRRARDKSIALVVEPAPGDALEVQADPTLLQRVLENLLENAFRYVPEGGRLAVGAQARQGDEGGVEIVVANDGPPIPLPERARVFNKFVRGDAQSSSALDRAGLGLYFCKCTVEAHGGTIEVFETAAWPTSFRIRLP